LFLFCSQEKKQKKNLKRKKKSKQIDPILPMAKKKIRKKLVQTEKISYYQLDGPNHFGSSQSEFLVDPRWKVSCTFFFLMVLPQSPGATPKYLHK